MKKLQKSRSFIRGLAGGLAVMSCVLAANAHPYASGITNNSGTISYILNEVPTSVSITLTNLGSGLSSVISGGTNLGVNTFSLGIYSNYSITVQKNGGGAFAPTRGTNLPPDPSASIFNGPRAHAINMNPKTGNFGRIYVVNASPSAAASPVPTGDTTRGMGKGVFVLNSDGSDADGYGTNAYPLPASWPVGETNSTGTGWGSSTTTGPWKVFVGPDDMVYVGDATSSGTGLTCGGSVWIMDPNLLHPYALLPFIGGASSSTAVGVNDGPCVSRPWVTGSLAQGNLVLSYIPWNYQGGTGNYNEILVYDITNTSTATLPYTTAPTTNLPGLALFQGWGGFDVVIPDIYKGPISGEWYESLERSAGNGINGWVFDPTGVNELWNSQINSGASADPLNPAYSVAVSPDELYVAYVTSGGTIITMSITNNGTVWAPDLSTCVTNATGLGGSARGITFDAADNITFDTGGDCVVRSYTLGLTTTCITANDYTVTNGTFSFSTPGTTVTVAATTNAAYKNQFLSTGSGTAGPSPGLFTLTRSGGSIAGRLTANVTITGTASNGTDYTLSPVTTTTVTFAAGSNTALVTVDPIHTGVAEPTTTVILSVVGGATYGTISPGNTATVTISDDAFPAISISTNIFNVQYEPTPFDYSIYTANYLGNTNTNAFTFNITYSGSAATNDYVGITNVTTVPGIATYNITNFSGGRTNASGSNTVIATIASGSGYTVGSPSSATNWIIYDEPPSGKVLFSDTFTYSTTNGSSSTASNYNVLWATPDANPNYLVTMPFDYSTLNIPPAPHTTDGSTLGVQIAANALSSDLAMGVNIYPILSSFPGVTNTAFSGAYSMRVDMFLIGNTSSQTTEYAIFGINHSGTATNWFDNSTTTAAGDTWRYDGLWYDIESDGASLGDYVLLSAPITSAGLNDDPTPYNNVGHGLFTSIFKSNPWTPGVGVGGMPANQLPAAGNFASPATPSWATVEIDQIPTASGTNITLKINNVIIMGYTNTNSITEAFSSGLPMLGHDDAYNGNIVPVQGQAIYDNLVITKLLLKITSIQVVSGTVTITFTWSLDEPATSFALQAASGGVATGSFNDVSATIVETSPGVYTATIPTSGLMQYYQVRHK